MYAADIELVNKVKPLGKKYTLDENPYINKLLVESLIDLF